ncbi:MAG: methyltransferase domain-containing protein, partial [Candidatus Sericytochromatia bacterium]|nr:methyltransferase domain-containing protein [Candidatus Sericytochromatia bacterium]
NHVLEHVNDPLSFLRDVRRVMRPGGIAHICVPNVECPEARLSGWVSFEPYHLLYFTPATLAATVSRTGLTIARSGTKESFSGWMLAVARTAMRRHRAPTSLTEIPAPLSASPARRPPWFEHAYRLTSVAVGAATWPLRRLQARLGFGDEIICVARRPRED